MERKFEIEVPLPIVRQKRKDKVLGLNTYRNLYFFANNKAKQNYYQVIKNAILKKYTNLNFGFKDNITITYYIFFKRKNRKDLMNYGSVLDKFFCDSISKIGIIEDDKIPIITNVNIKFGGYSNIDKAKIIITT